MLTQVTATGETQLSIPGTPLSSDNCDEVDEESSSCDEGEEGRAATPPAHG